MPSLSSVRRAGRWEVSTSRMISTFSAAGYLMPRLPHPRSFFFQQTVLQGELGHDLLQRLGLPAQVLDLIGRRGTRRVAREPLLARLEELLGPAVILRRRDPLAAAELGDAILAAQALQHDADLLFSRKMPARRAPDVFDDLLCRRFLRPGFLSHLRSCWLR